jgi:hypothetical protein
MVTSVPHRIITPQRPGNLLPRQSILHCSIPQGNPLHKPKIRQAGPAGNKAPWHAPEYRKTLLSIHIYEAVLQEGVRGVEAFMEWWRTKYQEEG